MENHFKRRWTAYQTPSSWSNQAQEKQPVGNVSNAFQTTPFIFFIFPFLSPFSQVGLVHMVGLKQKSRFRYDCNFLNRIGF